MEKKEKKIIKGLENELLSAKAEIKALKEDLRKKEGLIQKETEKRRARSNAYLDYLNDLTGREKQLKTSQAQCDALKAGHQLEMIQVEGTCRKKLEVLQEENDALKETVNRLTTVEAKSEDEVQQKDKLIQRETEKRRARTDAFNDCLGDLTGKEQELKSSEAQCDALKAGHQFEISQVEETCRMKLEVLQEENAALNRAVKKLNTEINTNLSDYVEWCNNLSMALFDENETLKVFT